MKYSVSIDVPNLDDGLKFYRDALGLEETDRPAPTYAILKCGEAAVWLMEKQAGTSPAKGSESVRTYDRHWTPVHIDFQVDDFEGTLSKVIAAGAVMEQKYEIEGRPPIAFCSDPFGNGFCIMGSFGGEE